MTTRRFIVGSAGACALLYACNLVLPIHEGNPAATQPEAGNDVVTTPPADGDAGATLLFRSGFEEGVTLDAPVAAGGNPPTNFAQHLHGSDDRIAAWPLTFGDAGTGDIQLYVGSPTTLAALGGVMSAAIESTTLPDRGTTRVLHQKRSGGGNVSYHFSTGKHGLPAATHGGLYVRHRMRLDANWSLALGTTAYRILFQIIQTDNALVELRLVSDNGKREWALARYDDPAGAPTWDETSVEHLPDASSSWFELEVFFQPGARAWVAIVDGARILEHATDVSSKPIDDLYLFMNEGVPGEQWSDDLEIWDGVPVTP